MPGHDTPLHQAPWAGDLAMVRVLVELGASTEARDPRFDATPLGWAMHNRQAEVVAYLAQIRRAALTPRFDDAHGWPHFVLRDGALPPIATIGLARHDGGMAKPNIVSAEEWQRARDELLVAEKEATRAQDALAARRRRLPMVKLTKPYEFEAPRGKKTLIDLFEGRGQLVVYQFMDVGPDKFCPGCTKFTNNVVDLEGLARRGVSWATVSNMPLAQIETYKARMGWTMPFVSSRGTSFADDCGARGFMLSAFLRDGDDVYRTYNTTQRGVDRLLFVHNILDLTAYGRQEDWEDSPAGWPQRPTYG